MKTRSKNEYREKILKDYSLYVSTSGITLFSAEIKIEELQAKSQKNKDEDQSKQCCLIM